MSARPAETIQTLLDAEEAAKGVIDAARRERDARLKQASVEAEAEISAYREKRESEYQAAISSFKGTADKAAEQIARDAKLSIAETRNSCQAKAPAVRYWHSLFKALSPSLGSAAKTEPTPAMVAMATIVCERDRADDFGPRVRDRAMPSSRHTTRAQR